MNKYGKSVSYPTALIWHEIGKIGSVLIREFDDGVITAPEIADVVHRQIIGLARVYHQLRLLNSEKEGNH